MMNIEATVVRNVEQASKLFQEHADTIRAVIAVHTNDKSNIDDLFQDFFLELVQKPIPRNIENVKGYLCRAVKNDVLDDASRTKSYYVRNYKYAQTHMDRFESQTPDTLAIYAEDIGLLLDAVKTQLYPYEAEAVMQKYCHDKDTDQASEAMGIHKRSFSRYLCTGMKKLQTFFREDQAQLDKGGLENNARA